MLDWFRETPAELWVGIFTVAASATLAIFVIAIGGWSLRVTGLLAGPIPVSHKIAVIGLPGAGKTTLITALFELIQRGVHVDRVRLHGLETITTVNKYIAELNSQEKIGPTKEKDIFVFRFSYIRIKCLVRRLYDVEIADFPGEYSERMSEGDPAAVNANRDGSKKAHSQMDFEYTLFNQEFFSWIGSSREYLFLVDLSWIYSAQNVRRAIADITARIRTSWQVIEDAVSERGIGSPYKRGVYLTFTKTDSVTVAYSNNVTIGGLINSDDANQNSTRNEGKKTLQDIKLEIASAGETSNLTITLINQQKFLQAITQENAIAFSDLISFFQNRTKRFDIIYTSMKIERDVHERLGVRNVLEAVLP